MTRGTFAGLAVIGAALVVAAGLSPLYEVVIGALESRAAAVALAAHGGATRTGSPTSQCQRRPRVSTRSATSRMRPSERRRDVRNDGTLSSSGPYLRL